MTQKAKRPSRFLGRRSSFWRELLEGKLLPFCAHKGYPQLRDLTIERMREIAKGGSTRALGCEAFGISSRVRPLLCRRRRMARAEGPTFQVFNLLETGST